MNRYPLWKYVVIAVALVVGFLYTLPNLFPEVPAVQVSSSKAAIKIDTALLGTIETALKDGNVPFTGTELDPIGIKVRLTDVDTQIKAKDLLQTKLGDNYIVALNQLSTSPRWLASIGALPMYLGLDLRGGVHFLLQVDMKAALDKSADRYTTDIRSLLREKKVQYAGIAREGANVVLRFRDDAERVRAQQRDREGVHRPRSSATRMQRRRTAPRRGAQAGGAEAHPGGRRPAEHPDPAQPRERARRRRADHPAAGRGARRRAAARRAGHGAGQGHPRPHRDARDPHGQRRCRRAVERRRRGRCRSAATSTLDRSRRAGARAPAGRADRRPDQRRAAGLRPAQQRARGAREPRRQRRADLQGNHARERRQADGDRAGREGQVRGHHGAGDPRGNRRRPRADQRQDEARARPTTSRS